MNIKKVDILVIGAGIAGLGAAYELQKNGKNVLMLEKEAVPGGRMKTTYVGNTTCDLGAGFITSSYTNLLAYAKALQVPIFNLPFRSLAIKKGNTYHRINTKSLLSFLTCKAFSLTTRIKTLPFLLLQVILYQQYDLHDLLSCKGLDTESVEEYFLRYCGKEAVEYFIQPLITGPFFYDANQMSKAIALPISAQNLLAKYFSFTQGIGQLAKIMSEALQIKYNHEVIAITRKTDSVEVLVTDKHQHKTYQIQANKLILALPGNAVLPLLKNPTKEEKDFFPHVSYGSTVLIHCKAKTNFFDTKHLICFSPKEEKKLAAAHINFYQQKNDCREFEVFLRNEYANQLINENSVNKSLLKQLIQEKLEPMEDLEIVYIAPWKSAIPIFAPGYIKRLTQFLERTKTDQQIFYCGDYIGGPYTELAFSSGLAVAKKIIYNE